MMACGREREVTEVLQAGHWPEACSTELREHVSGCVRCGELVLVTEAVQRSRAKAMTSVRLEAAGIIWWRAQLRRRQAAMEQIARPVIGAQIFAWVLGLVVLIAVVVREGVAWLPQWAQVQQAGASQVGSVWSSATGLLGGSTVMLGAEVVALLLLGGVVVMLAVDRR